MLRPLLADILRREGYTVLAASHGDDALDQWNRSGEGIDVVVTDVVMPNMSGKQLVERLRLLKPDLKVIYMSGYESNMLAAGYELGPNATFLQKPFRPVELSQAVRNILES